MRGSPFLLALLVHFWTPGLASAQETAGEPQAVVEEPPAAPEADAPPAINPNPLSSLSLESLTATRSLPLFTPSRTAPMVEAPAEVEVAAPVESQVDPEQPPPAVQLVGIVLTDSTQIALLLDPGSNEIHRLASGDDYDGWALKIVDARSVELRSGDRVQGLKMFESFPAPPPPLGGMIPGEIPPDMTFPPQPDEFPSPAESPPREAMGSEVPSPDGQPTVDFAPDLGGAPIPEEGALIPPQGGPGG